MKKTKIWSDKAWDDYLAWQDESRKTAKKINELIKDIERNGLSQGIGKPERLKHRKAWSRHIDHANRLIYDFDANKDILIFACKGHYDDR
jgi:toxin YoeB